MLVLIGDCRRKTDNRYNIMLQVIYKTVHHLLYLPFLSKFSKYSIKSLDLVWGTATGWLYIISRKGFLSDRSLHELLTKYVKIKLLSIPVDASATYRRVIGAKDVSHITDCVLVLLPQSLCVGVVPLLYSSSLCSGQSRQQGLAVFLFSSWDQCR